MSDSMNEEEIARWLEPIAKRLLTNPEPVRNIVCTVLLNDGTATIYYLKADMCDKILVSGFIQQDAMRDALGNDGWIQKEGEQE